MPTEDLVPNAAGAYSQWAEQGGTGPSMMSDGSNTTFISEFVNGQRHSYAMGNMTSPNVGRINKVTHMHRASYSAASAYNTPFFRHGGTNADGTQVALTASWLDYNEDFPTAPGGVPWTKSIVDATEIGVLRSAGNSTSRVSEMSARVDFVFSTGGFALFVSQWLPPLMALASHGLLKREAAVILARESIRPSNLEEFGRLLEAFQRRPRFCFQGRGI